MEALNWQIGAKDANGDAKFAFHKSGELDGGLTLRKGFNTAGKTVAIRVNQFKVTHWPNGDIFQYDIRIGTGADKPGKIMAVYKSDAFQNQLKARVKSGNGWLWDGNKIGWSNVDFGEISFKVDLDAGKNRPPRRDGTDGVTHVIIKRTTTIRMAVLKGYLGENMNFDASVLCAINFLDHAMRQWPSENYTQVKRSFFGRGQNSYSLDNTIVGLKGVYASIRLCNPQSSAGGPPGTGLAVNIDVSNGTFWTSQDLHQAVRNFCKDRNRQLDYKVLANQLKPVKFGKQGALTQSEDFKSLRKFAKLKFKVKHRNNKGDADKVYTIKKFAWDVTKGGEFGMHAKNFTFKFKDRQTNTERDMSIYDYFQQTYQIHLQYWQLPVVETERHGSFPMEVCVLEPNQRYAYKLDPTQTAAMIKFAVTRPKQRIESIQHGLGMLKWHEDPYLRHFGIKIDQNMTVTQAKILDPPEVQYANGKCTPRFSGRWDLRGKKFLLENRELNSWGICVIGNCTTPNATRNFINIFIQTWIGHGGKIKNKNPVVYPGTGEIPEVVAGFRKAVGNQVQATPQILFYVLPGRDSQMYERIKKNNECRFGIVTQMLNVAHVNKANTQYCSNVAMKAHAKMGGTVAAVAKPVIHKSPTMWIGADVSHASPGSPQGSMAAMTISTDQRGIRYSAGVQTNGRRVEMISPENIKYFMKDHVGQWAKDLGNGKPPQNIFYFRDGVSEGQYSHVLDNEVNEMHRIIAGLYPGAPRPKFTVVVCTKRHHIRFFPKEGDGMAADKNANPVPGTLVERDCTHPFEYDFYLNAHSAIQGTARPVHYIVLRDEIGMPVNEFQKMIYESSYQYQRSTTPVSLFPAIYYAHLASNRARCHDKAPNSDGPRGGQKFEELRQDQAIQAAHDRQRGIQTSQTGTTQPDSEVAPLMPLGNHNKDGGLTADEMKHLHMGMWFI